MRKPLPGWPGKSLSLLGVLILLLAGTSSCAQSPTGNQTAQPLRIGFSASSSGDFASDGAAITQGYQLWADTINSTGGILGHQVQLDILHDDSTPAKVIANYKKLITIDNVNLVFGPFSSLLNIPASVTANQFGFALPEGSGGGPLVFEGGLNNVFDVSLPVDNNLISFAYFILSLPQSERPKTAAYATEDDPFTQPQVELAKHLLESNGITTVYYKVYSASSTKDFTPYAQGIIQSGAQVVLLGTLLPDCTAFIKAFKQQQFNPQALIATAGPDAGSDFIKAVGLNSTEGIFVPNGWYPQANNFQNARMVQDYLTRYGGSADSINADVAEAYSVGQVAAQAIEKIPNINDNTLFNTSRLNLALIKELHNDAFNTVQGPVKFDATGQNTLALAYLFQWQRRGSFLAVYPSFVASANPEFPKPQWSS